MQVSIFAEREVIQVAASPARRDTTPPGKFCVTLNTDASREHNSEAIILEPSVSEPHCCAGPPRRFPAGAFMHLLAVSCELVPAAGKSPKTRAGSWVERLSSD